MPETSVPICSISCSIVGDLALVAAAVAEDVEAEVPDEPGTLSSVPAVLLLSAVSLTGVLAPLLDASDGSQLPYRSMMTDCDALHSGGTDFGGGGKRRYV